MTVAPDQAPAKLACYARSLLRAGRPAPRAVLAPIALAWRGLRIDARHVARHRTFCGGPPAPRVPFLYPLTLLFHYHLGVFGHANFPWSLRRMLGFRNHVTQHRRLRLEEPTDLDVRTGALRVLRTGLELDVHSVLSQGGSPAWESVHVYYLRGKFTGEPAAPLDYLRPLERAELQADWQDAGASGFAYARVCGDYNPAHYSDAWARLLGFRRAFSHTQRSVAEALGRLPAASVIEEADAVALDVAFKGPVYYRSRLSLQSAETGDGWRFDVYCGDAPKPAMPGRVRLGGRQP
jgi:hypothetical protein